MPVKFSRQRGRSGALRLTAAAVLLLSPASGAQPDDGPVDAQALFVELDREMQAIKAEILAVNREILALQETTLYPAAQQLVVMVTAAEGVATTPGTVTLTLDGEVLNAHDYSGSEYRALLSGGAHRLYTGEIRDGEHRIEVTLSGTAADGRPVSARSDLAFDKEPGRAFVEVRLSSEQEGREPALSLRQWR